VQALSSVLYQIPDVTGIVFFGPFTPADCPLLTSIDAEFTAQELVQRVIDILLAGVDPARALFIPSVDDATALPLMPHPAPEPPGSRALLQSDPCWLSLGAVNVWATAFDIPR
jgi:hypothetical protein